MNMNDYVKSYERSRRTIEYGWQRYMVKVYAHVASALLITAVAAAVTVSYTPLINLIFNFDPWGNIRGYTALGYVVAFAPFFIAMYVSNSFYSMPFTRSRLLLAIYAALVGMSCSSLAFFYTTTSLHKTFLITAVTFGVMSLYGYTTNRDLSAFSSFFKMALLGLILSSLVNIFFKSEAVYFVSSFVGVIVFTLFVAYNTNSLKRVYYEIQDSALAEKAALMGAFTLYLNFLNLFFYLLRFMGERKKRE